MDWALRYDPGQVRASCSICGCSRRFPDNLTFCVDQLFRCERCMEITAMERDQQILAFRMRPDEPEVRVGLTPQGDVASTFLADSADYRASVLPGWTPSSQFYDDFAVVPGGVGSSWTNTLIGAGAITQPSANVARFDTPAAGSCRATATGVTVPNPSAGNFFCAFRAKTSVLSLPGGLARGGARDSSGTFHCAGANGFGAAFYSVAGTATRNLDTPIDTESYHVFRVWWKLGGAVFGSVDSSAIEATRTTSAVSMNPFLIAQNSAARMDVTHYVCWT